MGQRLSDIGPHQLVTVCAPSMVVCQAYTSLAIMDRECAFCGRAGSAARRVLCEDCQAQHNVCGTCADEVAAKPDGYRLVA